MTAETMRSRSPSEAGKGSRGPWPAPVPGARRFYGWVARASRLASALVVVALVASLGAGRARAGETGTDERREKAGRLYDEGVRAFAQHDYPEALRRFREANALVPDPNTTWNIVVVELKRGMNLEAHHDLEGYLAAVKGPSNNRFWAAVGLLIRIEETLAHLTLQLDPSDASVHVDNLPCEHDMWLSPGKHDLRITAPGRVPRTLKVFLKAGEQRAAPVTLERVEPPPLPEVYGLATLGVGVAGLTAGGILGALVLDHKATMDRLCSSELDCKGPKLGMYRQLKSDAVGLANGSNIGFIAGGVLAGLGLWLTFAPPQLGRRPRVAGGTSMSLSFVTVAGGAAGALRGEW